MKSILLIEDDPFVIDIYTTRFQNAGFSIETAEDGKEGLEKLKEKKFDLLLLDIVLPHINGWEILEEINEMKKTNQNLQDLKIIILSNLGQKEEVEKGLALGATKYIIKAHYTPADVVEEIKKILK